MNTLMIAVSIGGAKSIVDYIFRWIGKKFPRRRPAGRDRHPLPRDPRPHGSAYANGGDSSAVAATDAPATPADAVPPGQTALFNAWEDAVECSRCGGRMVRTGSCYTCHDCGTNAGCS